MLFRSLKVMKYIGVRQVIIYHLSTLFLHEVTVIIKLV